ncbi:MAG: aromatic amino acid lyase [Bradymonadales bacterium]|nr:MAG: aromatic amino acid lyase [Bradymonadales bacterium]
MISLGKGYSGLSYPLIERHLAYLNRRLTPRISSQGSVGASGDLAPLAELALTFIAEGSFLGDSSESVSAKALYKKYNWKPLSIGPKEGLALTNGTQASLAMACEVRRSLSELLPWMELTMSLSVEAHRATASVFQAKLHRLKAHRHQQEVAARLSRNLRKSEHMKAHRDCDLVQDAYSFRCMPQILGPCYSLLEKADELLEGEINSVSDNPIVFFEEKEILSCGHFHAQSVSFAADLLAMAMVTMGNLIERRMDQMVNPASSRHPAFLADRPGVESGLMIVQTAAAALASENKGLAFPASADTIPTNGNQEDHVSMAPWAARKASQIADNLWKLVAAELICSVRASVLESTKSGLRFSPTLEAYLKMLADLRPELFWAGDRNFGEDWRVLCEKMKEQSLEEVLK